MSQDAIGKVELEVHQSDSELQSDSESLSGNYKKVLRKIDFRILILYSIVYLFTQINKQNISNTAILNLEAGHGIKQQLKINSQQWAWCVSIFYYPYMFFEPISTLLLKHFSPKVWQSRIMITWGGISMCQAASRNFLGLVATRFFLGLAEAGYFTSVLYHLSFWIKPRELPKRVAFFYSIGMLSGAVSGLVAYGISFLDQKGGLSGWQWVFIFEGIPTVLLGIFSFFYLPNFIEDANFLTQDEKDLLASELPKSSPTSKEKTFEWLQIKVLLKEPTFYTFSLIWAIQGIGGFGVSNVLPTVIYELGFESTAITQLLVLPPSILGFCLLNILGWFIHNRFIKSFHTVFVLAVVEVICYAILMCINNSTAKYLMLCITTAIANSFYPLLWPERLRTLKGSTASGLAIGITNGVSLFSGIVTVQIYQPKFGPRYRISYACSVALCSAVAILVVITWWLLKRDGLLETEGAMREEEEAVELLEVK